jgi:chromosome segregation ATPase
MRSLVLVAAMVLAAVGGAVAWPFVQPFWHGVEARSTDLRILRADVSTLRAQQAAQWAQIEVLVRSTEELRAALRAVPSPPDRGAAPPADARAAEARTAQLEARTRELEQRVAALHGVAQGLETQATRAQGAGMVLGDRLSALERTVRDRLPALERTAEDRMQVLERSLSDRIAALERRGPAAPAPAGALSEAIDQLRDEIGEIKERIALLRR